MCALCLWRKEKGEVLGGSRIGGGEESPFVFFQNGGRKKKRKKKPTSSSFWQRRGQLVCGHVCVCVFFLATAADGSGDWGWGAVISFRRRYQPDKYFLDVLMSCGGFFIFVSCCIYFFFLLNLCGGGGAGEVGVTPNKKAITLTQHKIIINKKKKIPEKLAKSLYLLRAQHRMLDEGVT